MLVSFNCEKLDYEFFKNIVGPGNAGPTLRGFIRSYREGNDLSERQIFKEYEILKDQHGKLTAKFQKVKARIEAIQSKKKQEELENLKKQEKELKKFQDIRYEQGKEELRRWAIYGNK